LVDLSAEALAPFDAFNADSVPHILPKLFAFMCGLHDFPCIPEKYFST